MSDVAGNREGELATLTFRYCRFCLRIQVIPFSLAHGESGMNVSYPILSHLRKEMGLLQMERSAVDFHFA